MPAQITYFVHGTTADNEAGISSGWKDVELSDLGVKQSKELRGLIADRKFDAVFSSDLKRAVNSTNLAFEGLCPIFTDKRLRECNYGDLNGAPSSIVEPRQEKNFAEKFPNGESYEDVKSRVADFTNFLRENYDGKQIAIVAHKAPQLALEVLLNGKTWQQALRNDWRKSRKWQAGWDYVAD